MTALSSVVDLAHGGRWTSLRAGEREWLWRRTDPARSQVRPGQAFVDAGGIEECPADGTAVGAILTDCPQVTVADGPDTVTFRLSADGQPVSTALWRNLGGFPQPEPYRSIGVEPMLGRVFDVASAGAGDAATVPASGVCTWRLEIT